MSNFFIKNKKFLNLYFSKEYKLNNINVAIKTKTALVIGTTGLNENILKQIEEASKSIPILQSTNMSLGVNTLFNLVENSSSILTSNNLYHCNYVFLFL